MIRRIFYMMLVTFFANTYLFAVTENNLLRNTTFDDGLNAWDLHVEGDGVASYNIDGSGVISGNNSMHVVVTNAQGGYPSGRIQLIQHYIIGGIEQGETYHLTFKVKSTKDISKCFWTIYDEPDINAGYYKWDWITLEAGNVVSYSYNFTATATDPDVYFAFDFAALEEDDVEVWIDDVDLEKIGSELLTNNKFNDGDDSWSLHVEGEGVASYNVDGTGVISGNNSMHVVVTNAHNSYPSGRIQLTQHSLISGLESGETYNLSFKIKSNKDIDQCFWTMYEEPEYNGNYYNWAYITLKKDEIVSYNYTFTATVSDPAYFAFDFAALEEDNVELWIDDVYLTKVDNAVEEENGKELLYNNSYDDGKNAWDLHVEGEGIASYDIDVSGVIDNGNSMHVVVTNAHNTYPSGRIQLIQHYITDGIENGASYNLTFQIKSNKNISRCFWTIYGEPDISAGYYNYDWITLEAGNVVSYSYNFEADITVPDVYFAFDFAALEDDAVELWIDNVHLVKEGSAPTAQFPPETSWDSNTPNDIPMPGYRQTVKDSEYGMDITRISDPNTFGVPEGSSYLVSNYPKIRSWNADMSLIILGNHFLVNANDYTLVKTLPYLDEPRWSNVDPNIIFFKNGSSFAKIDINTEVVTNLVSFPDFNNVTIGPWEGSQSADDKYVVITDEDGGATKAVLYNIQTDQIESSMSFSGDIDWVSITPSGNYIVVNDRGNNNIDVYDLNFNYLRTIGISSQHGDFGVDSEGNEVWVQVIPLSMSRLSDGKYTRLLDPNIGGHISGRGFDNPGWAFVSTDINHWNDVYYYSTQLFEIKLDGSGIIRHFGHARASCNTVYPFGGVSPDGKKAIFGSDWDWDGNGVNGHGYAFVTEYSGNAVNKPTSKDAKESGNLPIKFVLNNYPNPFNPTTTINFSVLEESKTSLTIYNVLGKKIKVIVDEVMRSGNYSVRFDGSMLPSGIYFYRMETAGMAKTGKMMLLK